MVLNGRVAVVWRGNAEAQRKGIASNERLRPVVDAIAASGLEPRVVVYRDEIADSVRAELLAAAAVLVWVDPIGQGEDRGRIDGILGELVDAGVFVSARPDVVAVLGTKEVLLSTRDLGWGTDVRRWDSLEQLREGLVDGLAGGPRVLKPRYANGGIGVWKVELAPSGGAMPRLLVHGAERRDTTEEHLSLEEFLARCAPSFADGGCIVDQSFQPRVSEGLIRCYLVHDRVVGFARQSAEMLLNEPGDDAKVMGLPSPKAMFSADAPDLARLRALVQDEWVPELPNRVGIDPGDLPVLWDADFILGPPLPSGEDTYVLCEINCSCVTPFPPSAPARIAAAVLDRLDG